MVTFNWRDYKDGNKVKEMTVSAEEFIRCFMLHILPPGLRKIRHFGFLAQRDKTKRISLCKNKKLTKTVSSIASIIRKPLVILQETIGR